MADGEIKMEVDLERLFLSVDNPRHEEVDSEERAIERLCKTEDIVALARDIATHGVNPAERLILVPVEEDEDVSDDSYFYVAEGNRRVCALKLLSDPDLAPPAIRSSIRASAKNAQPIGEVDAVVITDDKRRRHWLQRIHDGAQGGRGRKPWNAEQKTRFTGSGRNAVAQAILDYSEERGLIVEGDRRGMISHLSRLLSNALIRDALGLNTDAGPEDLQRSRPLEDFNIVLMELLEEGRAKSLGSQVKKEGIDQFAHKLQQLDGLSGVRCASVPLEEDESSSKDGEGDPDPDADGDQKSQKPKPAKKPKKAPTVAFDDEIGTGLEEIQAQKLQDLYYSICKISAEKHATLISIGVWSFLESLCAMMGANDGQSFTAYLGKGKISELGVAKGRPAAALHRVLDRLSDAGNRSKHHAVSGHYDWQQLINDMATITPLIRACISEIKKRA